MGFDCVQVLGLNYTNILAIFEGRQFSKSEIARTRGDDARSGKVGIYAKIRSRRCT